MSVDRFFLAEFRFDIFVSDSAHDPTLSGFFLKSFRLWDFGICQCFRSFESSSFVRCLAFLSAFRCVSAFSPDWKIAFLMLSLLDAPSIAALSAPALLLPVLPVRLSHAEARRSY